MQLVSVDNGEKARKNSTCLITRYSNTIAAQPTQGSLRCECNKHWCTLLKCYIVDWTYFSTKSVLNNGTIPYSTDCLHGGHWEDLSANQGSFHGHKTAVNTVKSFIGYTDSDLRTAGGNIWDWIDTLFGYCISEETRGGGKGEISPGNHGTITGLLHVSCA